MSTQLSLPSEYGYVLLTATASSFLAYFHSNLTGQYRKAAQVPYPNSYASAEEAKGNKDKYLFNCAQRAHANFLEHQPQFLLSLLISGLRFPVFSAVMGVIWCAGRVVYALGYTNPDKENGSGRLRGNFYYIGQLGLLGGSLWTGLGVVGLVGR
ncbi:MAG: hypothetical protein LQ343_002145 [Gyalolechia ehrenbergii]|nr:MAG: hypothetical protein LQ343_002145 [Gyalolechia ehrenbergii]